MMTTTVKLPTAIKGDVEIVLRLGNLVTVPATLIGPLAVHEDQGVLSHRSWIITHRDTGMGVTPAYWRTQRRALAVARAILRAVPAAEWPTDLPRDPNDGAYATAAYLDFAQRVKAVLKEEMEDDGA